MSIKNIVRREEEEEVNHNWVSAALVLGAFGLLLFAFPKYVTTQESKGRKYYA